MRHPLDYLAEQRAERLACRVASRLPVQGRILDVGSGVGHNAVALARRGAYRVFEVDVDDFHLAGPGPVRFDGERLPFQDRCFDAVSALFVLQYARRPERLLREMSRVTSGPLILVQSTYRGRLGLAWLRLRERFMGRWAFRAARWTRYVSATAAELRPRRCYTRERLAETAAQCALRVAEIEPEPGASERLSRDLFVLLPR